MATITGPLTALHIIYPVSLFVHLVVHHILGRSKTPLAPSKEPLCPKLVSYVRAVFGITYALQLMALFVEIFVTQDCCFACAFACDSGAGMASCFLYLGLISLLPDSIISDRPFQHWHTYLGLGLTVIFEPLVHLGDNFYMRGLHQPVFQAIHLSMAAIRYAPLVCSLAAAVIDRYHRGKMDYVPLDEERECLLPPRSSITGGPRASDMKIRRDYGTVSGTGPASPDVECDPATEIQQIDSKDAGVLQFLKRIIHVLRSLEQSQGGRQPLCRLFCLMLLLALLWAAFAVAIAYGSSFVVDNFSNGDYVCVAVFYVIVAIGGCIRDEYIPAQHKVFSPIKSHVGELVNASACRQILSHTHGSIQLPPADIVRILEDAKAVSEFLEFLCTELFPAILELIIAIPFLAITVHPTQGFLLCTALFLLWRRATADLQMIEQAERISADGFRKEADARETLFRAWPTVMVFNQAEYEANRFTEEYHRNLCQARFLLSEGGLDRSPYVTLMRTIMLSAIGLAFLQSLPGWISPATLTILMWYSLYLVPSVRTLCSAPGRLARGGVLIKPFLRLMESRLAPIDKKRSKLLRFSNGPVSFEDVSLHSDPWGSPVPVDRFTHIFEKGKTVTVISEKGVPNLSALFSLLLLRLEEPTRGVIRIDGQDIGDIDIKDLRDNVGVVHTETFLFDDTLINNVRYAKVLASDAEVQDACERAHLLDQSLGFSNGYETRVGGPELVHSGYLHRHQRFRIGLARIFLQQPQIVILDEAATLACDMGGKELLESLSAFCKDRTTIMTPFHGNFVLPVDQIVVLRKGQVQSAVSLNREGEEFTPSHPDPKNAQRATDDQLSSNETTATAAIDPSVGHTRTMTTPTPMGHRREGSKLNPDAPEFTPGTITMADAQHMMTPTPAYRMTPLPQDIALPKSVTAVQRKPEFSVQAGSPSIGIAHFDREGNTPTGGTKHGNHSGFVFPSPKRLCQPWDASEDAEDEPVDGLMAVAVAAGCEDSSNGPPPKKSEVQFRVPRDSGSRFDSRSESVQEPSDLSDDAMKAQDEASRRVSAPVMKCRDSAVQPEDNKGALDSVKATEPPKPNSTGTSAPNNTPSALRSETRTRVENRFQMGGGRAALGRGNANANTRPRIPSQQRGRGQDGRRGARGGRFNRGRFHGRGLPRGMSRGTRPPGPGVRHDGTVQT